ncbi:MAG: M13 family metallopeptidase [Betaproteobacteria bacterium]|nr:M13 family metallopeptidase [Betaproteobacteria bacterium]
MHNVIPAIPVIRISAMLVCALLAGTAAASGSGIDKRNFDTSVRIQDDLYRHVNGNWLKQVQLPADKSRWGTFDELRENSLINLRNIIETLSKDAASVKGSEEQKIADAYASFVDEAGRDARGYKPVQPLLARIDAVSDKSQLPALMAELTQVGISLPYSTIVNQDGKDSSKYAVLINQAGLGLPDRDYYLSDADEKNRGIRAKYVDLIARLLTRAGEANAAAMAKDVMALETALAKSQWARLENRNPVKTYNKVELGKLAELAPGFDWNVFMKATGVEGKTGYVIVRQPSYLTGFAQAMQSTPLPVWTAYFKWQVLNRHAAQLDRETVADHFAFFNTTLLGIPENEPAWKRGVRFVEAGLGEALGKRYVQKHFPPEHKAKMEKLVANVLIAFRDSIDGLEWMSPATKKEAKAKLATFSPKIGYTEKWRDYAALSIARDDLVGNAHRISRFDFQRNLAKLGKPIDRTEWGMTPQTVNAYYSALKNEIVFPAAILQPPFFNADADDAVNYGGIGAVIGHEIGHGFDDSGSQYDGSGNLRNWWTAEDREKYLARAKMLVAQYDKYSPVPGYFVNGSLTLGENIGDNSGLAIAYKAYQLALGGKPAPVIDGYTGPQRFYIGFAQIWRRQMRDDAMIVHIKTDTHTPGAFRANGTVRNQPGFYEAFGVKAGDKLFLPPEQRVTIW